MSCGLPYGAGHPASRGSPDSVRGARRSWWKAGRSPASSNPRSYPCRLTKPTASTVTSSSGVSPVMPVFIEDNGRSGLRKVLEAVRGAGGTLVYVLGTSLNDVRKAETLRDDFPEVTTITLAELAGPPLLTELGRSGDAPARPAVPALHGRRRPRLDPDAQRSRSRRDGERPGAARRAAAHETDRRHRLLRAGDAP